MKFSNIKIEEVLDSAYFKNNNDYFIKGIISYDEYLDKVCKLITITESNKKLKKIK